MVGEFSAPVAYYGWVARYESSATPRILRKPCLGFRRCGLSTRRSGHAVLPKHRTELARGSDASTRGIKHRCLRQGICCHHPTPHTRSCSRKVPCFRQPAAHSLSGNGKKPATSAGGAQCADAEACCFGRTCAHCRRSGISGQIIKGIKPGDLPGNGLQSSSSFHLKRRSNRRDDPPTVLARRDRVIN